MNEKGNSIALSKLNCSKILEHVQRAESLLPEFSDAYFGHPNPPKLSVLYLDGVSLLVSHTKRCVSAQIHCASVGDQSPGEIISLPFLQAGTTQNDEAITALAIITSNDSKRVAVVVGTTCSRVLCWSLTINSSLLMLERTSDNERLVFEPLPLDSPKDSYDDSSHSDSLSISRHGPKLEKIHDKKSFRPKGGVHAIEQYNVNQGNVVWISYKDGTLIRLASESFFASAIIDEERWKEHTGSFVRAQVMLPPTSLGEDLFVVALPKYHPSPLAPFTSGQKNFLATTSDSEDGSVPDFYEAMSYGGAPSTGLGDLTPTITFYTSEDQFLGRTTGDADERKNLTSTEESVLFDSAIEATSAIVGGVFGAAIGVVKWGFGGRRRKDNHARKEVEVGHTMDLDGDNETSAFFTTLHKEPVQLYCGTELHDAPRLVTSVTIDPKGNLAATTDTLGRVLLIDLATKQVVKMWKGVRDATCCWMEHTSYNIKSLYIVIHSRQRRTVEVWKIRHGGKVLSIQVGRDAQLVQCKASDSLGCMLLQSATPGSSMNLLELLVPNTKSCTDTDMTSSDKTQARPDSSSSIQAAALRLQTLHQLLAETNVPCHKEDILETLKQITNLQDWCTALDLLSVSKSLEERMGVRGTEFQKLALAHCRKLLENSRIDLKMGPQNPHIEALSSRIKFHTQIVDAFDLLREFEENEDAELEGGNEQATPRSAWSVEGLSWLMTAETVFAGTLDDCVIKKKRPNAQFASFASSCSTFDQVKVKTNTDKSKLFTIYFSDSSRTRKEILVHIFKPLLNDIFSYSVTNSILERLGLRDELDYLQTCFGEWFMSVPAKEAANKAFFGLYAPMARWLQEMVNRQIDLLIETEPEKQFVVLGSLHRFCTSSDDLVRAFALSSLCREAVSVATKKKEVKTFGKIWREECVHPWESLLRKLRVCLLVSLRLHGMNLGTFPITVENVDNNETFSIYEWVARDELLSGHKHEAIVSLEKTCRGSGMSFDPSTSIGDHPARWKLLQLACLATAISEEERAEYLVDVDDDVQGALLLYLGSHNNPSLLVAHRALLLAGMWKNEPSDLALLQDCTEALLHLDEEGQYKALAGAIRMEVWQTCIRPVFRALFFGFHDVHQVLEDVIGPLFLKSEWLRRFEKTSLELLFLLYRSSWGDSCTELTFQIETNSDANETWPPIREDFILKRLVDKTRAPNSSALDLHQAIICGSMASDDYENLANCINGFHDAFLPSAISNPPSSMGGDPEKQMDFLERASVSQASRLTKHAIMDHYDLGEIETLAELWGIEARDVRTIFVLAMYELGKDAVVDALVTRSAQKMDLNRFVEDGLGIICRRLNRVLNVKRTPQVRKTMGLLDADTCEWVREQAALSVPLHDERTEDAIEISLSSTHLFILRLLGFSSAMGAKGLSVKIHSLSILSGTLMKSLGQKN